MGWIDAVDGLLWLASLIIVFLLAQAVYQQQKGTAEKLFLGMVTALSLSIARHVLEATFELLEWVSTPLSQVGLSDFFHNLWPVDIAALVIFASLSLHFALVFPRFSSLLRRWPRFSYVIYAPALPLAGMILTRLWLSDAAYRTLWHLGRTNDDALQLTFVVVLMLSSVLRWAYVTLSTRNTLVRRRMMGFLGGISVATLIAVATDYVPDILRLSTATRDMPGLQQLPTLIFFVSFAWTIQRDQIFDVRLVLSRSLAYTLLSGALTLLYALVTLVAAVLLQRGMGGPVNLAAPLLASFVMVAVAIPVRNAVQRLMDRLFFGRAHDYRQVLREHSRQLTALMSPAALMDQILDRVEANLHPRRVMIALWEDNAFVVRAARGRTPGAEVGDSLTLPAPIVERLQAEGEPVVLEPGIGSLERMVSEGLDVAHGLKGMSLIVPFVAREELLGWLGLWPRQDDVPYTPQQRQFLATLIDQSCVALQNAELYEKMKRKASELAVLNAVSTAITSTLDLDEVLQTITDSVMRVVGCQKITIRVLDETRHTVNLAAAQGLGAAFVRAYQAMPLGDDPRTTTIVNGQTWVVSDVRGAPECATISDYLAQEGIQALAEVPLWGKEGTIGSLAVYYTAPHRFSDDELELLTTLAAQASIALENARLYALTDQALAQRVEELSAILNSVHEGILMTDLQDRIVMVNPTVEELLEKPRSQLIGHTLLEVMPKRQAREDRPSDDKGFEQLPSILELADEASHSAVKTVVETFHPRHRFLEHIIAPVEDGTGSLLGRVVILRDITEEKELERMREDLTAMIIHDLRAPLSVIISGSTLLQEVVAEKDLAESVPSLLEIIVTSGQRMSELVNLLLDISRLESGKLILDTEPFDLLDTVQQVMARLQPLSVGQEIDTKIAIPPGFPWVWADREKIARVLTNLVDNAIKFTPPEGWVRVSAHVHEAHDETVPGWVVCSVLDTGPGIPPEHRERIFEKFTQLASIQPQGQSDERVQGSGIGLNFCKLVVEAHGGRIWVEDGPHGRGSNFQFTLPLADELDPDMPIRDKTA